MKNVLKQSLKKLPTLICFTIPILLVLNCSNDNDNATPDPNLNNPNVNTESTFTAMVDGVQYTATTIHGAGLNQEQDELFIVSENGEVGVEISVEGTTTGT